MNPEYLTPREVAIKCRVAPDTVKKWRLRGEGPKPTILLGRFRYRSDEVSRWLDQRTGHGLSAKEPTAA